MTALAIEPHEIGLPIIRPFGRPPAPNPRPLPACRNKFTASCTHTNHTSNFTTRRCRRARASYLRMRRFKASPPPPKLSQNLSAPSLLFMMRTPDAAACAAMRGVHVGGQKCKRPCTAEPALPPAAPMSTTARRKRRRWCGGGACGACVWWCGVCVCGGGGGGGVYGG